MFDVVASSRREECRVTTTVQDTSVIDTMAFNPQSGEVTLIAVEERAFGSDPRMLAELQAKLNTYLRFALDGQLAEDYPQHAGHPVRIQLDCRGGAPDAATSRVLAELAPQIEAKGVGFHIEVR
jgi:hypothetical protein